MSWKTDIIMLGAVGAAGYFIFINADKIAEWLGNQIIKPGAKIIEDAGSNIIKAIPDPIKGYYKGSPYESITPGGIVIPSGYNDLQTSLNDVGNLFTYGLFGFGKIESPIVNQTIQPLAPGVVAVSQITPAMLNSNTIYTLDTNQCSAIF